uniref:Uncharacterized protein n=1 Tax=Arundo donax TaxID=35708 RepID=A0A0A9B8R6_ARUDO
MCMCITINKVHIMVPLLKVGNLEVNYHKTL